MEQIDLSQLRSDLRKHDQLREVRIQPDVAPSAAGSVLFSMGNTQVICAVCIEEKVPAWMRIQRVAGGWLTAEYRMLPYASGERKSRPCSLGKIDGRTQEIQRLIGRSLRAAIDLGGIGSRTIWVDCDVLQADGGTRTASVTGGFIALRRAVDRLLKEGRLEKDPIRESVAAVSAGIVAGRPMLDLCYEEDAAASVDMNVVMTGTGKIIEVQGTAEEQAYSRDEMQAMMDLTEKGIQDLFQQIGRS